MEISNYGSVIELLTVFHFIYYLGRDHGGRDYFVTLTNLVFRSKERFQEIFNVVESKFVFTENEIQKISNPPGKYSKEEIKKECRKTITKLRNNFNFQKEEFFNQYKKANLTTGFSKISFFLALYCLALLFLSGFLDYLSQPYYVYDYLYRINFVLLFTIIAIFINDITDSVEVSVVRGVHVLITVIILLVIGAIYYWCNHNIYHNEPINFTRNWAIITSLTIITSNFLLYICRYIITYYYYRFKAMEMVKDIESSLAKISALKSSIHDFEGKIESIKEI